MGDAAAEREDPRQAAAEGRADDEPGDDRQAEAEHHAAVGEDLALDLDRGLGGVVADVDRVAALDRRRDRAGATGRARRGEAPEVTANVKAPSVTCPSAADSARQSTV